MVHIMLRTLTAVYRIYRDDAATKHNGILWVVLKDRFTVSPRTLARLAVNSLCTANIQAGPYCKSMGGRSQDVVVCSLITLPDQLTCFLPPRVTPLQVALQHRSLGTRSRPFLS
jgi:hypothetical protein